MLLAKGKAAVLHGERKECEFNSFRDPESCRKTDRTGEGEDRSDLKISTAQ